MKSIAVILLSVTMNLGFAGQAPAAEKRYAGASAATGAAAPTAPSTVTFQDVTQAAGIRFTHNNGAFGKKYLPETMGPGVAFIDYDNDGWPDIFLVNGMDWPGHATKHSTPKLYHNNHDGTFTDVTHKAGLDVEMLGMGVAVGDFDNDGFDDLFVTAYGQSRLFHNNGNGTFSDVTQKAGLNGPQEFSTSAAFVDYDKDGKLDLVVGNYVRWSIEGDLYCTLDGKSKSYCTPESYKGTAVRLWHNRGDGTFEDVTQKAGLGEPTSKTLGIALLDYDNDGWIDLLLSNDTQPNKLYHNNGNGTFTEKAVVAGVAFSEDGIARAGMGVDAADYDHSGNPSLLITNFSNQMISLYHNEGKGLFVDEAPRSDIGRASLLTLGFGCFFFDYDLDGWVDVLVANGHIDPDIQRVQANVKYAMPPHLFRNDGNGKFEEVTKAMGVSFNAPEVARGAAYADVLNNGRLDLLIGTNGGSTHLFRNVAAPGSAANQSVRIKLVGTKSNRDGIGAVVKLTSAGVTQTEMMRSGSSYLSASELVLTFGLGQHDKAEAVEIHWPSGQIEKLSNVMSGQTVTVTEGNGVSGSRPYKTK
ncbi:MAG TPA: CRTAC1 family protein [Candidatus Dormibacteraeota bacterium]|nr:CRTAC1 family protein [Candidatus Dormibacteraeota bacterium]